MSGVYDLTGHVYGRLTVLSQAPNQGKETRWWCECSCGNVCMAYRGGLRNGTTQSCGCLHSEISKKAAGDLTGEIFGRLTVVSRGPNQGRKARWNCQCRCGNTSLVRGDMLRGGIVESCGCIRRERLQRDMPTHGMSYTPEYLIWKGMKQRCENPKSVIYPRYGGRGITVCERWQASFEAFYQDVGPRPSPQHSLERIDNNGPYTPENVCWATADVQMRNKRTNRLLTFNDKTACLEDWAIQFGMHVNTLAGRLDRGWSVEKALLTPIAEDTRHRVPPSDPEQPMLFVP